LHNHETDHLERVKQIKKAQVIHKGHGQLHVTVVNQVVGL